MDQQLQECHRLIAAASRKLESLERGIGSTEGTQEALSQATSHIESVIQQASPRDRQGVPFRRIEALAAEAQSLQGALNRVLVKQQKTAAAEVEKEELLRSVQSRGGSDQGSTAYLASEEHGLRRTQNEVRKMVRESAAVLGALQGQRQTMTRTEARVGDLMSKMGVSSQIIDQIMRTSKQDRILVLCGTLLLLLLMGYIWFR